MLYFRNPIRAICKFKNTHIDYSYPENDTDRYRL
jgi:hypothetical protein